MPSKKKTIKRNLDITLLCRQSQVPGKIEFRRPFLDENANLQWLNTVFGLPSKNLPQLLKKND